MYIIIFLQQLLSQLEESVAAQTLEQEVEKIAFEEDVPQPEVLARDFLSARDLKTVRQDSKKYSGCFGRRLDRIGSTSNLGCNTVGRQSKLTSLVYMFIFIRNLQNVTNSYSSS